MTINKKYTVKFKRKRSELTDYRARLRLILSKKTRLVVRKSLNNVIAQLVNYDNKSDKVVKTLSCRNLREYGWKYHSGNLPSAYLLGLLIGLEAKKLNVKEAVFDIGLSESVSGSSIYALLKGALDSGLQIPHGEKVLPGEERINGKHIVDYYNNLSQERQEKQFSKYLKNNVNPANIVKDFQEVKSKILNKYKNG
ncbi:MAG: 50S ribosomal protein L18 [Nanoarchaeota archaeon]